MVTIIKSMDSTTNPIASNLNKSASSLTFSSINNNVISSRDTARSRSLSTASSANGDNRDNVKSVQTTNIQNVQLQSVPAVPTPPRSRRVHEKSRAGCQICRKRHVKVRNIVFAFGNIIIIVILLLIIVLNPSQFILKLILISTV